jgi:hypothetical protein
LTTVANAKPEAAWPDGKELEVGTRTLSLLFVSSMPSCRDTSVRQGAGDYRDILLTEAAIHYRCPLFG